MPFGAASVVTDQGRRTVADRLQTTTTRNPPKFIGIGNMATSFTFAVVNLANGDSIQFTIRLRAG
jgi:hypothetical protein